MRPFRVSRQGGAGLSYAGTRRSAFRTPTAGVRVTHSDTPWLDDVRVSLCRQLGRLLPRNRGALLGLPLPAEDGRPLHVTVPPGVARGRRRLVTWHEGDIGDSVITRNGLRITDPVRTWVVWGHA